MSHEEMKARSRKIWGTGDYGPTSRQLQPASAALVDALEIAEGQRVLDVAAGDGNAAIAAARRGATVCASDFSPRMIDAGRARTRAEGLDIEWREADAADLPFVDESFDRVTSVFGAIFAPEQTVVASETVRVTRPGGVFGFTAWTPDGFTARMLGIARSYWPPAPADAPDPFRWGHPDQVRAIFSALGCTVDVRSRAVTFRYASWEEWRAAMEAHGMAVVAKESLSPEAFEEQVREIRGLVEEYDYGDGGAVVFDAEYLEVLVAKP